MKIPNLVDQEDITEQPILELSATTQLSDYVSAIAWSPTGNTLAAACCSVSFREEASAQAEATPTPTRDPRTFRHERASAPPKGGRI